MKHGRRPAGIRHRSAHAGSVSSPTAHPAANGAPPLAATRHPASKCLCVLVHGTLHWFRDNSALSRRGFAGPLLDLNSRRLPGLGTLHWFLERRWRPASDERRGSRRDGTPSKRRPSWICARAEFRYPTARRARRAWLPKQLLRDEDSTSGLSRSRRP